MLFLLTASQEEVGAAYVFMSLLSLLLYWASFQLVFVALVCFALFS